MPKLNVVDHAKHGRKLLMTCTEAKMETFAIETWSGVERLACIQQRERELF